MRIGLQILIISSLYIVISYKYFEMSGIIYFYSVYTNSVDRWKKEKAKLDHIHYDPWTKEINIQTKSILILFNQKVD